MKCFKAPVPAAEQKHNAINKYINTHKEPTALKFETQISISQHFDKENKLKLATMKNEENNPWNRII